MKHIAVTSAAVCLVCIILSACGNKRLAQSNAQTLRDAGLVYKNYHPQKGDRVISRSKYLNQLYGFWLGECIANWTGLATEMDKTRFKIWPAKAYLL